MSESQRYPEPSSARSDAARVESMEIRLPPGPETAPVFLPSIEGEAFLHDCQHRYGGAVTLSEGGFTKVMVFDPVLIKEIFRADPDHLRGAYANMAGLLGERSVMLLEGAEHLRHRRLMLPPFHGERMRDYEEVIRAATDEEISSWPVGESFALRPSTQSLTLAVIVRAVFGFEPGAEEEEMLRRLGAILEPLFEPRPPGGDPTQDPSLAEYMIARMAADELIFAEISRRRADPELGRHSDLFSMLLQAKDEAGEHLSDQEVRDQLNTLLIAGHELTANALAWVFHELLRAPTVLERARLGERTYLDAVIKETLRLRLVAGLGRTVHGTPFQLGDWVIPAGAEIHISISATHHNDEYFPEPEAFRPERFLGEDAPDTFSWIPFGGGTRRCLGASFAQMEMRIIVGRILERTDLTAVHPGPEAPVFRAITVAPEYGTLVTMSDPARPGSSS